MPTDRPSCDFPPFISAIPAMTLPHTVRSHFPVKLASLPRRFAHSGGNFAMSREFIRSCKRNAR
ncbi:hypothetical protein UC34_25495 [Pandoraea vervacti]|uniref:Uncharacterized protein n=1 Tax=Pandoraea vervacti TaxID=656178 RepID=A0ABN4UAP8_9BURK|nr:hypothetical protein UC34_25495 [Pandoraea vervacti]